MVGIERKQEPSLETSLTRPLTRDERSLLQALAEAARIDFRRGSFEELHAQDMNDGEMGSIRFVGSKAGSVGTTAIEAEYVDEDGTPVVISLILDDVGFPYEIDFWKVDFQPLRRYPAPHEIRIRRK